MAGDLHPVGVGAAGGGRGGRTTDETEGEARQNKDAQVRDWKVLTIKNLDILAIMGILANFYCTWSRMRHCV